MKKNAKKRIALTLATVSAIGIGAATMSKAQETNAMMRIFGGIRNILTGRSTSTGTSYLGTPKTVSLVNNSAFSKNIKTHTDGSKTSTSRNLNGSKGSINSGVTTSNGTMYQGMEKNQTNVNNKAFDKHTNEHKVQDGVYTATKVPTTGSDVTAHPAPQTQMKTLEKQLATSSKKPSGSKTSGKKTFKRKHNYNSSKIIQKISIAHTRELFFNLLIKS